MDSKAMKLLRYLLPATYAAALICIVAFSAVPPNLILVSGAAANAVLLIYAAVLVTLLGAPNSMSLHKIGAALAVFAFAGRGFSFFELVIENGRSDLLGAVAERLALMVGALTWHVMQVIRIGLRR